VSIPAGTLLHRIGYKRGIIAGLGIMGLGCLLFIPAASYRFFPLFLAGYFILASGMTILQVAANPFVTVLGDEKGASSRLNLSQAFNSLGTTIAPIVGAVFILSDHIKTTEEIAALSQEAREVYYISEASAVQQPFLFLALALIALALVVVVSKLPGLMNTESKTNYTQALKDKKLKFGAIGIFLYVGAEVAIGSYAVNYFLDMNLNEVIQTNDLMRFILAKFHSDINTIDAKAVVATFLVFYWGGAMVGRFVGAVLTRIFHPNKVLSLFGLLAMAFVLISMSTSGLVSMWALLAVGFFNSIMFPTIFSLAIEDLGELKPEGSGILCTAIAGGAFIPPLYGFFTDMTGFKAAFILVLVCYGYVVLYGRKVPKLKGTI
ncbi:MAG: sugar MFS transporter, partial [Schleiferiaceae bacterium]|nr:sugar MFS transporter [Schleiferiaceae bacterium]